MPGFSLAQVMEKERCSQVQGESQIAQTIGLDELSPSSQRVTASQSPEGQACPWGRLFPLNFLFGDNPHSLWDDVITVGRAEDCTIGSLWGSVGVKEMEGCKVKGNA